LQLFILFYFISLEWRAKTSPIGRIAWPEPSRSRKQGAAEKHCVLAEGNNMTTGAEVDRHMKS